MREGQMKHCFRYELKKIYNRKIVWITVLSAILLTIFTICVPLIGNYYVDGTLVSSNYDQFQIDAAYKRALDGRLIDDACIKEMQEAYGKVDVEAYRYSLTEEYQNYARPYSDIFHYIRQTTGHSSKMVVTSKLDVENVWKKRQLLQEERWDELLLTESEKEFWREKESQIPNPITYRYVEGYTVLFDACYTVGIVGLFVIAVCMSGVFPQEHIRKTDQLILSSKYGRWHVFWMKFAAGIVVSFFIVVLLTLTAFGTAFALYGLDGFDAAFQMYYIGSSLPISIGEAVLIAYLMEIITVLFMAVLVMVLSELLNSSVGTLAIAAALIIAPMMVSVPDEYRLLAQLWSTMPGDFVAVWSIFSARTVPLFGKIFTMWQIVPVWYLLLSVIFTAIAKKRFVTYQISGR